MYGTDNINIDMASGRKLTVKDVLSEPSAAILTLWCKKQIDAARQKRVPDALDVPYDEATRDATIAETVRDASRWSIGAVTMKITSSTSMTSTIGTTLISASVGLTRRPRWCRPPAFGAEAMTFGMGLSVYVKFRSAIFRNSSAKSSIVAENSFTRCVKWL